MIDEKELSKVLDKWSDFWEKKTDGRSRLKWTTLLRVRALVIHFPKAHDWILCNERLPEANKDVLICFPDGDVHIASRTHEELSDFIDRECNIFKKVVAWQPLPEPYKAQDS